ncbi:MAG: hypothetical protein LBG70_05090, partial [Bifidobacteriaceae bacterium]|nr:hypothetical protein [Bifidobacteriaceae bacterium]
MNGWQPDVLGPDWQQHELTLPDSATATLVRLIQPSDVTAPALAAGGTVVNQVTRPAVLYVH